MSAPNFPAPSLVVEKVMPLPSETIWRALTQASLIDQWLMSNDLQPAVGHKFTLRAAPMARWNGVIECEVVSIEPIARLSYTWNALGLKSLVTWALTPSNGATRVRMEQSGFRSKEDANSKGATYGWQKFIASLEQSVGGMK